MLFSALQFFFFSAPTFTDLSGFPEIVQHSPLFTVKRVNMNLVALVPHKIPVAPQKISDRKLSVPESNVHQQRLG